MLVLVALWLYYLTMCVNKINAFFYDNGDVVLCQLLLVQVGSVIVSF